MGEFENAHAFVDGIFASRQNCRGGLANGRSDKFFRMWGGGAMCHPPVSLIEDDCAG